MENDVYGGAADLTAGDSRPPPLAVVVAAVVVAPLPVAGPRSLQHSSSSSFPVTSMRGDSDMVRRTTRRSGGGEGTKRGGNRSKPVPKIVVLQPTSHRLPGMRGHVADHDDAGHLSAHVRESREPVTAGYAAVVRRPLVSARLNRVAACVRPAARTATTTVYDDVVIRSYMRYVNVNANVNVCVCLCVRATTVRARLCRR